MKNPLEGIDPADITEFTPVDGFTLAIQVARSSGKVPKGWAEKLNERGLSWEKRDDDGGMLLSFRTRSFTEFRELKTLFLQRMPWSREIVQSWQRKFRSIDIIYNFNDDQEAQKELHQAEVSMPFARLRGISPSQEDVEELRQARRVARERRDAVEEQLRLQHRQQSNALSDQRYNEYLALKASGDATLSFPEWERTQPQLPEFNEWRKAIDAGQAPQLLLPAAVGVEPEPEEVQREPSAEELLIEKPDDLVDHATAWRKVAAEDAQARADAARSAYDDVRDFFLTVSEIGEIYTLKDVMRDGPREGHQHEEKLVREALDKLITEGIVREGKGGFEWTGDGVEEAGE